MMRAMRLRQQTYMKLWEPDCFFFPKNVWENEKRNKKSKDSKDTSKMFATARKFSSNNNNAMGHQRWAPKGKSPYCMLRVA